MLLAACAAAPPPPGEIRLAGSARQGALMFGTAPPGTLRVTLDGMPVRLAGDRRFVIGFGRDTTSAKVIAELDDGREVVRTIDVRPREWQIESIPGLRPPISTGPSAEYEAIRAPEIAALAAGRAGSTAETGWSQAFAAPATGRISGVYGSQRILGGVPRNPHSGLDIAAPSGTPVLAPADGVVRLAQGPFSLEGNVVLLDHGYGLVSSFLHLSRIDVVPGERVARGDRLGAIGTTGRSTGPHLHWGLTWGEVKVDPQLTLVTPL